MLFSVSHRTPSPVLPPSVLDDELFRRLDFRFLLPDPRLGDVAYGGDPDTLLARALTQFSGSFQPIAAAEPRGSDLVVLVNPPIAQVESAATCLRSGGYLYAEFRSSASATAGDQPARPAQVAELLPSLGFSEVSLYWHRPDFESCKEMVPLKSKEALIYLLTRNCSGAQLIIRRWFASMATRTQVLERIVSCVSFVARRTEWHG
jgi:hypothetical protein